MYIGIIHFCTVGTSESPSPLLSLLPPAGPQASSSQLSEADSRRSILEAVAKQTGGKLVEQAPPPETVVSDALSDEEVERKSKTIVGELSSNGDYRVC